MHLESTRMKLLIVAVLVAVAREVAAHQGLEIPTDTFVVVEGLILGLMGLDTARPLGKPVKVEHSITYPGAVAEAVAEAAAEASPEA